MRATILVAAALVLFAVVAVAPSSTAGSCEATNTEDPCVSAGVGIARCYVHPFHPEVFYCTV